MFIYENIVLILIFILTIEMRIWFLIANLYLLIKILLFFKKSDRKEFIYKTKAILPFQNKKNILIISKKLIMRKLLLGLVTLMSTSFVALKAQEIKFETGSWSEVKALAQKAQKPIFVDVYAVWCGPCKYMTNTVFKEASVANFMNEHYINYKLDGEKGEGLTMAKEMNLMAYPTLYFFDKDGNAIHKYIGGADPATFLKLAQETLKPENQLYTLKKKFDEGQRDKAFMQNYLNVLKNTYEEALMASTLEVYWQELTAEEKNTEENMNLVTSGVFDMKSPIFEYFLKNRKAYEETLGEEYVNKYAEEVMNKSLESIIMDETLSEKSLSKVAEAYYPLFKDRKIVDTKVKYAYYSVRHSDSKAAYKAYDEYFNNYAEWSEIMYFVWHLINDHETVNYKKALAWMNTAVKQSSNAYTLEVRATLYYKMGKKKEALADATASKKLYDAKGEVSDDLEALLKQLQ